MGTKIAVPPAAVMAKRMSIILDLKPLTGKTRRLVVVRIVHIASIQNTRGSSQSRRFCKAWDKVDFNIEQLSIDYDSINYVIWPLRVQSRLVQCTSAYCAKRRYKDDTL